MRRTLFQRITLSILLVGVLVVGTVSPLASRPARAMTVVDPVTGLNTTIKNIWDYLKIVVVNGGTIAIINAANFMMQRLAYDSAVYLASGGKGETPLFENKSFGAFAKDLALSGAGEALGSLTELGFIGFNLCDPTAAPPSLRLSIFLGLAGTIAPPPRPRCEWNDIQKNWDEYITSVDTGEALRGTLLTFQPGQSELGVAFGSNIKILEIAGKKTNEGIEENRIGQGFKSLVNPISGGVKTPSQNIKAASEKMTKSGETAQEMTNAEVAGALGAGAIGIIPAALSMFTNTFASQLMHRIFTEGLFDIKTVACPGFDLFSENAGLSTNFGVKFGAFGSIGNTECALNNPEFAGRGGRAAAQASFADFLTPRIIEAQNYDAITDFTVCPDAFRTPSNCVMDSQFAAAVRQADQRLTVSDAITRGYLHGDWPLVSLNGADAAKNADPFCFTTGYCYSNLVKLRKARIIPIGWELAAAKATNGSPTLKEVIDKFNDCPTEDSPLPQDHPWCRLIDPNWILKYPVTQCKAKVYGPTLMTTESDLRAQICVDTPSCIAENAEGTCESGYGYCTREKNIWRLGGDECPGQYATCATFTPRPGGTVSGNLSLLSNTVDRSVCTSDNVGCRGYALDQDSAEGADDWLTSGRVFLDRDAGVCEDRDAGCTELYPRQTVRENLVRNSSFELDDDRDGLPDSWRGAVSERADTFVDSGIYSIRPSVADNLVQTLWVEPGHTYTLSAAVARADAATPVTVRLDFYLRDKDGQPISFGVDADTTCDRPARSIMRLPISPEGAEFERLGCRFTVPDDPLNSPNAALNYARISISSDPGPDAWLDSIQIEEGPVFSTYHEQTYVDSAASYLRLAPDFLGCTGDPATDDPSCASYSAVCRADEVGCERYTPTDGSPPIPGIISNANLCPNECAGYSTWRQEPSNYDTGSFPLYFIPSSAQQCSAAVAGCSEFTNLDTLAAGGEAREYYSYIRACEKPEDPGIEAIYYTWEGSDTSGFQLKEWRFVSGDPVADRPEEVVGSRPPQLISPVYAASCTSAIYAAGTNPDCREFFDTSGNRSYRPYSRTVVVTPECHPYRITNPAVDSALVNEGLCEALDPDTNVPIGHWVPGAGDAVGQCVICARFGGEWNDGARECTYKGFSTESASCGAAENGCRLFTGNAGRNVRVLFTDDFEIDGGGWTKEGATVSAESTIVGEHSLRVDAGTTLIGKSVAPGSDSAIVTGGTYYLSFWAKGRGNLSAGFDSEGFDGGTGTEFANGTISLGGNWQVYNFGPVFVDHLPAADERLVLSGFADISYVDNISLRQVNEAIAVVKNSWITPASCDQTREGAALPQAMLGCSEYNDRQGASQTLTGFDSICRDAAVGCQAFADTRASDSPGRETWNAMCVIDAPDTIPTACLVDEKTVCTVGVGVRSCRYQIDGVADTVLCRGEEGPCLIDGVFICDVPDGFTSCRGTPADTLLVPEDITRYIVEDQRFQCEAAKVGCTDAGLPKQAVCNLPDGADDDDDPDACQTSSCDCLVDGSLVCRVGANETACRYPLPFREPYSENTTLSYESAVVQNAPRTYERSLCTLDAVGCEEWSTSGSEGGTAYFKAPDDRICEYRENVSVNGTEFDGWFREGTNDACDPNFIIGGTFNGIRRNGDFEYQGFAGSCPANFAGCTEFRDPSDTNAALYPEGKPYYALKNAKLDTSSCNNQVSQKAGCVLFNDTSNALLSANSEMTYLQSETANQAKVPSFSCEGEACGQCQYRLPSIEVCYDYRWGDLCDEDSDCVAEARAGETTSCVRPSQLMSSPARYDGRIFGELVCAHRAFDENGVYVELDAFRALYRGGRNDANTVIQVKQDRVCGEWLACRSRSPVFDSQTGAFKEVCNLIGTCDAVSGSGESIQCTHWVTDREPLVLTEETYQNRDVSFAGQEYAGYSIPNQFPADSLEQVGVGSFCNQTFNADGSRTACEGEGDCAEGDRCEAQFRLVKVIGLCTADDGEECRVGEGNPGTCYSNKCVVSIRGSTDSDSLGQAVPLLVSGVNRNDTVSSCRAYPERNSPFPGSVAGPGGSKPVLVPAEGWKGDPPTPESVVNGFQRAKICEKDQDCECSYIKASYSAGDDRFFNPSANPYEGLCQGGTKDGETCLTNDECKGTEETDIGTCQPLDRKDRVLGLEGYCLERDASTPLNGQQFDVVDLQSRACNTWLPVDRLAGSADIYNNFPNAGFNPTGNVYACMTPEVYKVSKVYGDPNHKQNSTRTIDGKEYKITTGCWEYDGNETELTLVHGRDGEDLEIFDEGESGDDKHPSNYYCTKDDGFMILARTTQDCGVGDNDVKFICVPKNSVHMALPDRPSCKPSDAGGGLTDAFGERGTRLHGSYRDTLREENPSIWIVAGGDGRLSADTESLSGPFADRGNVIDVFADCETTDADVTSEDNERNPGAVYFGCQDVIQVAKAGENPKAVTGNIGNGRTAPPGSGIINTVPIGMDWDPIPTLEYNWHSPPPAYGLANTGDITRVTVNLDAPLQLPFCSGPIAVLPKAAADPGADTPLCVQPTTTTGLKCEGEVGACDPEDYDDCIEKIVDDDLCGDNAIPIIGWCNLEDTDTDLSDKCTAGALGDDECPYKCVPLNSFHTGADFGDARESCDAQFETYARERNEKKYIRIDSLEGDDRNKLSNSRFNDCVVDNPADTEAQYGFPEHFQARPYVDIRYSRDRSDLGRDALCDDAKHCRDYGADEPVTNVLYKVSQRLNQLFTKIFDIFRYTPRSGNTPGYYKRVVGEIKDGGIPAQPDIGLISENYPDLSANPDLDGTGPVILAVGECFEASRCLEGAADRMTANGKDSGDVIGGGGQLGVELKFYAYADNDQMPIRQLVIDWGDGTVDGPFPGSYKNHRGFRRGAQGPESLCNNSNFGTSPDACDDSSPFVYAYTYTCDVDVNGNGVCPANATNCTVADANLDGRTDCVYVPRVQVKDNWGFCNGRCNSVLGAAGASCYDDSGGLIGTNECVIDSSDLLSATDTPWTVFSGRIVVSPR